MPGSSSPGDTDARLFIPMRLTDTELREVLARAEEIQHSIRYGSAWETERAAVISAGEELGLSRESVELALSERFHAAPAPPEVGSLVWARSADDKFYVAEVRSTNESGALVRFLRGSEHKVSLDQLRPCSFLPGERIICHWPWWGAWTCTVISYDADKQRVKVSDGWGYTRSFPIREVSLAPPREEGGPRMRVYATLFVVGAGLGAVVGAVLTRLLFP
jgi:hypothetical protein